MFIGPGADALRQADWFIKKKQKSSSHYSYFRCNLNETRLVVMNPANASQTEKAKDSLSGAEESFMSEQIFTECQAGSGHHSWRWRHGCGPDKPYGKMKAEKAVWGAIFNHPGHESLWGCDRTANAQGNLRTGVRNCHIPSGRRPNPPASNSASSLCIAVFKAQHGNREVAEMLAAGQTLHSAHALSSFALSATPRVSTLVLQTRSPGRGCRGP